MAIPVNPASSNLSRQLLYRRRTSVATNLIGVAVTWLTYGLLIVIAITTIFPYFWMISSSLQTPRRDHLFPSAAGAADAGKLRARADPLSVWPVVREQPDRDGRVGDEHAPFCVDGRLCALQVHLPRPRLLLCADPGLHHGPQRDAGDPVVCGGQPLWPGGYLSGGDLPWVGQMRSAFSSCARPF